MAIPPVRKHFNTAGPCNSAWHYMVAPLPRLPEAHGLAEGGAYFVIHAPRQTGKTTFLRAFAEQLTGEGRFTALYASCEAAEADQDRHIAAQETLVRVFVTQATLQLPPELRPPPFEAPSPQTRLSEFLAAWARHSPRPIVLLLDEIDALRGQSLISVLRGLRAGFPERPGNAPWSVVLCGLRDVRDYKAASGGDPERLGTSSPFNVKLKSLRLGDFDDADVTALLGQHTAETGQSFEPEAVARVLELAGGQPWLVNALAHELVDELKVIGPIASSHVEEAKERLILARATHLDSLVSKLAEPRVRSVLEPLLAGEETPIDTGFDEDAAYVVDLGLVKDHPLRIANPIYQEVVARVLSNTAERRVRVEGRAFIRPDGSFDLGRMLEEFRAFWIEQGAEMSDGVTYREAGAQLVLMAFLQRVVNGGGTVTREYGFGMHRVDLLVTWPHRGPVGGGGAPVHPTVQREAIELKVWRDKRRDPLQQGLAQLDQYLARLGLDRGTLIVFDRRQGAEPIEQRTRFEDAKTPSGRAVRVLRA